MVGGQRDELYGAVVGSLLESPVSLPGHSQSQAETAHAQLRLRIFCAQRNYARFARPRQASAGAFGRMPMTPLDLVKGG
jgi:hypothetical protein